jgi:hypothetical protein
MLASLGGYAKGERTRHETVFGKTDRLYRYAHLGGFFL